MSRKIVNREIFMLGLLEGLPVAVAAYRANISPATAAKLRGDPAFQAELEQAQAELRHERIRELAKRGLGEPVAAEAGVEA